MLPPENISPNTSGTTLKTKCIEARSALHYHLKEQPTHWDLNVYRGCAHGCVYCFAHYSHEYLGSDDFFGHIVAKTNLASLLHKEFSRPSWRGEAVNLGGVSDSYQPAEAEFRLLPAILEVFIRHSNPLLISTKSDLILRDKHLFSRLAGKAEVRVAASITTTDDRLASLLEPGAVAPSHRFAMLRSMKQAGVKTYVLLMPVIPYLTDAPEALESVYQQAALAGIEGIIAWPMNLRGKVKPPFLTFLRTHFPALLPAYAGLYHGSATSPGYMNDIVQITHQLEKKYGIPRIPRFAPAENKSGSQLNLF